MLHELRIRDFAIIDDLTISFESGLNVITGETGAGKSVIMQALSLACGGRAAPEVIRTNADAASIEALFSLASPAQTLAALGVEAADEVLVRRLVARTGKGRSYVNGALATATLLSRLGDRMVHVYGQHDRALLLHPASHLDFLDRFGDLTALRRRMARAHAELAATQRMLDELGRDADARQHRREVLEFHMRELREVDPKPDEEPALRRKRELLRHAERLEEACRAAEGGLYSNDEAIVTELARLVGSLRALSGIDPALGEPVELIETARVQLEEAALRLRAHAEGARADPDRLESIDDRLDRLARLARKHGVPTTELPARLAAMDAELAALEARCSDGTQAEARLQACRTEALRAAAELSAARSDAGARLERDMQRELAALGMRDARFRVIRSEAADGTQAAAVGPTGLDTVEFHLSANRGEAEKPLARIASGGELSRIMLALKTLTASAVETPTLIFDEVDAGIGGAVADAVARRLKTLARDRQLLCITHLPQIAAHADHHLVVEKRVSAGRTIARARALGWDERVSELTRMLGGTAAPAEAERYARRLIARARAPAAKG